MNAYNERLAALRNRTGAPAVALPYFPAASERVATASGDLADLIKRRGLSPRIPIAERTFFPPRSAPVAAFVPAPPAPVKTSMTVPSPSPALSPLAAYLRTNLAAMLRLPAFAIMFPRDVTGIGVSNPDTGTVFLLNSGDQIVGRIQAHRENGRVVDGRYLYVPSDRGGAAEPPFALDLSRPIVAQTIASNGQDQPLLLEPARAAPRPLCAPGRPNSPTSQC